ncbi:hypothetical protein [Duganella hordei]|uniref:hypothetical protein n=1 Tax=Duganella hordei TaxID=2865934 RepID=UPI00333F0DAB
MNNLEETGRNRCNGIYITKGGYHKPKPPARRQQDEKIAVVNIISDLPYNHVQLYLP